MIKSFRELKPYLVILRDNPLLIAAILLSSLLYNLFSSIQPMFIKTFLNGISQEQDKEFLIGILCFVFAGLLVAYLFDLISVALRFLLKLNFNKSLYAIFSQSSLSLSEEAFEFSMTDGLPRLTESVLKISIDLFYQIFNLSLIVFFLCLESKALGFAALFFFVVGQFVSYYFSSMLSRFSRFEIKSKEKLIRSIRNNVGKKLEFTFFRYYLDDFSLNSLIFLVNYILFQVFPIVFLLIYSEYQFLSIGSITSVLLYIGMLSSPYKNIVEILKYVNTSVVVTKFIRQDLERYLKLLDQTENIDKGIILVKNQKKPGGVLVNDSTLMHIKNTNLFQIDGPVKSYIADEITLRSYKEKVFVYVENIKDKSFGHFVFDLDNKSFKTVLAYD